MVASLLIIISMITTLVVSVVGIVLVASPYGETWAGGLLAGLAAVLATVDVLLAREHWGLQRRRHMTRTGLEYKPAAARPAAAPRQTAVRRPRQHTRAVGRPGATPPSRRKRPAAKKSVATKSG